MNLMSITFLKLNGASCGDAQQRNRQWERKEEKEEKGRLIRGRSCLHASFQLKHFLPLLNPIFLPAPPPTSFLSPHVDLQEPSAEKIFFVTSFFLCRRLTVCVCKYEGKIETSALLTHSSYTCSSKSGYTHDQSLFLLHSKWLEVLLGTLLNFF